MLSLIDRTRWTCAVLAAPDLTPGCKVVAARLILFCNLSDGRCDPSVATIAREVAMTPRAVEKMLLTLTASGWIERTISPGRRSNSYTFPLDRVTMSPSTTPNDGTGLTPNVRTGLELATPSESAPNPVREGAQPRPSGRTNRKRTEGENREENLIPPVSTEVSETGTSQLAPSPSPEIEAAFAEWWRTYPRREGRLAAKKAYAEIVERKVATPAELLAGAMRYAAAREGEPAQFTKAPVNWLRAGSWEDAAPADQEPRAGQFDWMQYAREHCDAEEIEASLRKWGTL